MSKRAEEAALKRFPEEMTRIPYQDLIEAFGGKEYVDFNSMPRGYFQLGYEQAEKDLELTWEDVKKIVRIADYLMYDAEALADTENRIGIQPYYEDVLRRFNEAKK